MAFCSNCGKRLADGEVCSCMAPAKKSKAGLFFLIVLAIALVVLAAVLIFFLISGADSEKEDRGDDEKEDKVKSTYMDPVNDFLEQVNNEETDYWALYTSIMPDNTKKQCKKILDYFKESDDIQDVLEELSDEVEDIYEDWYDEYGDWQVFFEEEELYELEEQELDEYKENVSIVMAKDDMDNLLQDELEEILEDEYEEEIEEYADEYDISEETARKIFEEWLELTEEYEKIKMTEGYRVTGKFILEGEEGSYESDTVTFAVIKINGSWVYMGLENFDDEDYGDRHFFYYFIESSSFYTSFWNL